MSVVGRDEAAQLVAKCQSGRAPTLGGSSRPLRSLNVQVSAVLDSPGQIPFDRQFDIDGTWHVPGVPEHS